VPTLLTHLTLDAPPLPTHLLPLIRFNDTPNSALSTLSLHDALPISRRLPRSGYPGSTALSDTSWAPSPALAIEGNCRVRATSRPDRKSTRLNSSHVKISYAVFCLKTKTTQNVYLFIAVHHS